MQQIMRSALGLMGTMVPMLTSAQDTASTAAAVPVREVTASQARSAIGLTGVTAMRVLSDGAVFVNDYQKRQIVRFDPTLKTTTIVADTAPGALMPYGQRPLGMLPYLGDSTIVVDPSTLSLVLLDPKGRTVRVMASPRPNDINTLSSVNLGTHAVDAQGRLYYRQGNAGGPPGGMMGAMFGSGNDRNRGGQGGQGGQGGNNNQNRNAQNQNRGAEFGGGMPGMGGGQGSGGGPVGGPGGRGWNPGNQPDSVPIVRVDFDKRSADTVTFVKVPKNETQMTRGEDGSTRLTVKINPMPQADDWALLADGTVAVMRVLDYHVDYYRPDGKVVSSNKLPFDWKRISDEDKGKLVDSLQALAKAASERAGQGGGGFRMTFEPIAAEKLPDYYPPIRQGSSIADRDGNLWVVPTTSTLSAQLAQQMQGMGGMGAMGRGAPGGAPGAAMGAPPAGAAAGAAAAGAAAAGAGAQPRAPRDSARAGAPNAAMFGMMASMMNQPPLVYDVIAPDGALQYRVKLPSGRQIAGFGTNGRIYLQAREGRQIFLETVTLKP